MQILIYNDTFQINCQPYADFVSPFVSSITGFWDKENPCLFMVKVINGGERN